MHVRNPFPEPIFISIWLMDDYYFYPAVLAFSGGPRNCIGQRFATTESICIIASIVRRYEILLPEDMLGLDFEEQKRRLAEWKPGVTIVPANARLRFRLREM